ncbi:MAG: hypothetical protein R2716_12235 [Microthrixaceae bacterium]
MATDGSSGHDPTATVEDLLERHGRTYASEARIRLSRNTPAPLFQLLCTSLLISARISADAAISAARGLWDAGLTTPQKMCSETWEARTRVLNRSGYARYDESTSRYLASTAETLIEDWHGDLRKLRSAADGDLEELRGHLVGFKGIGPLGADVFIREVQAVWDEYVPFVDDRSLEYADALELPSDPERLHELVGGDARRFARFLAALVRSHLAGES